MDILKGKKKMVVAQTVVSKPVQHQQQCIMPCTF